MSKSKARLTNLDGLRGIAVILVILTHVPTKAIFDASPSWLEPILSIIFANGKTGVLLLFILTGFLMGLLYKNISSLSDFFSRRYARIYPPFFVMAASLAVIRGGGRYSVLVEILIVISIAFIGSSLWSYIQAGPAFIRKNILKSWLFIQSLVGLCYLALVKTVDPSVYFNLWPKSAQALTNSLVNITLTLPFGQYVPQLDGVYWSLVTELLFYLTFPFIFLPVLKKTEHSITKRSIVIASITLVPFFLTLQSIFARVFAFHIINIHFFIYFVAGTVMGFHYKKIHNYSYEALSYLRSSYAGPLLLIALLLSQRVFTITPKELVPLVQVLLVFPMSCLVLLLVVFEKENRFFSHRILTLLGKYSFSLYLTHSIVIEWVSSIAPPTSVGVNIINIVLSHLGSLAISILLFELIEKKYFQMRARSKRDKKIKRTYIPSQSPARRVGLVTAVCIYIACTIPVSLFTYTVRHGANLRSLIFESDKKAAISTTATEYSFKAKYDNLGMILSHIGNSQIYSNPSEDLESLILKTSILDKNRNTIHSSESYVHAIGNNRHFPFGMPIQQDSKGETYTISYELNQDILSRMVFRDTRESELISVYLIDKNTLLSKPSQLINWTSKKLLEPLKNPSFWIYLVLIAPATIYLSHLSRSNQRNYWGG